MSENRQPDQEFNSPADAQLRAALRERARETPPPEIDARILAAARRGAGSAPQALNSKPRRWFRLIDTPFATAAVVLVSATLLLLMREQGHFDRAEVKDVRQEGGAPPASVAPAPEALPPTPAAAAPAAQPQREDLAPAQMQGSVEGKSAGGIRAQDKATESDRATGNAVENTAESERDRRADTAAATTAAEVASPAVQPPPALQDAAKQRAAEPAAEAFPAAPTAEVGAAVERREQAVGKEDDLSKKNGDTRAPAELVKSRAEDESRLQPESGGAPMGEAADQAPMTHSATDATLAAPAAAASPGASPAAARLKTKDQGSAAPALLTEQERLLQEIRQLIKDGKFSNAQLALRRFTKAYPRERIPADILAALKPAD